jgi:hypothetical protein
MSGNNTYSVTCPVCGVEQALRGKAMTRALTCKACNMYFRTGQWEKSTVEFLHTEPQAIPIGAKGKIDDFVYEVMGFVVKQETKYKYRWREYLVFNPYRGYAFLSEYNGHWNFVWPIEHDPKKSKAINNDFIYKDVTFQLYQKYTAQVVFAKGEFFFDVVDITSSTVNYEYIGPPYMVALEKSADSVLWCEGQYFTPNEVAEAFSTPVNKLPSKDGIGYTQPFKTSFTDQSLIAFSVLILLVMIVLQLMLNNSSEDKVVFSSEYNRNELKDQKMLTTPSFDLDDGIKNLEIYIFAPVSNDWFFSEFSLINDGTGEEYNFTKEVEFYSGYDDGGSWTEGSQSGEAFLSQIPAGKYHLNIYPEFSFTNQSFSLTVKRDVPMSSNFFITCLAISIFPAFYMGRKRYREQKRWSDSDYSPYSSE